jgi:hypothetical protein
MTLRRRLGATPQMPERKLREATVPSGRREYPVRHDLRVDRLGSTPKIASIAAEREVNPIRGLNTPQAGLYVIGLFGASGAILPLAVLNLQSSSTLHLGFDHLLSVPRLLVWPTSIFMIEMQNPDRHCIPVFLSSYLLNITIYFIFGSLIWLGLVRPRSIVYLTIVGIMYLTVVGVAGFCEWLLT